jgi:hypothetical protein
VKPEKDKKYELKGARNYSRFGKNDSAYNGIPTPENNYYSLDKMWQYDFLQTEPQPICKLEGGTRKSRVIHHLRSKIRNKTRSGSKMKRRS